MIGQSAFIRAAQSWTTSQYVNWLTEGLAALSAEAGESVEGDPPFSPLLLSSPGEPAKQLSELYGRIRAMPQRIQSNISNAIVDLLSAFPGDSSPRFCDLAWRMADGLKPAGGLVSQARHLLVLPALDADDSRWLACLRSMEQGVLGYAPSSQIMDFFEDFRESKHWRSEFALAYVHWRVRHEPRQWLAMARDFLSDIRDVRRREPGRYKRFLYSVAVAAGPKQIALHYEAIQFDPELAFLLADLKGNDVIRLVASGDQALLMVADKGVEITFEHAPAGVDERERQRLIFNDLYSNLHSRSPAVANAALQRNISNVVSLEQRRKARGAGP